MPKTDAKRKQVDEAGSSSTKKRRTADKPMEVPESTPVRGGSDTPLPTKGKGRQHVTFMSTDNESSEESHAPIEVRTRSSLKVCDSIALIHPEDGELLTRHIYLADHEDNSKGDMFIVACGYYCAL